MKLSSILTFLRGRSASHVRRQRQLWRNAFLSQAEVLEERILLSVVGELDADVPAHVTAKFEDAYQRTLNWGEKNSVYLGVPFGTVHAWGDGWIQDFRDGRYGDGAIMLSKTGDTDTAYAIWGKHWELYKQQTMLGTQPPTSGMEWLGYPTSDHRQPSAEEAAQLTWFDNSSPPENLSQGSVIYTKLGYITFKEGTDHAWWATSVGQPAAGVPTSVTAKFADAYQRTLNWGEKNSVYLGVPFGTVHAWGDGWIQDFRDGRYGDGAIMLSKTGDTDTAYAIWGKHWELYKQQTMLGTQPPTSGMEWLGYPTSDHRQPSAEEAAQLTWFDNSSPPENLSQGSVIYTKLGYITFKEGTDHAWWATSVGQPAAGVPASVTAKFADAYQRTLNWGEKNSVYLGVPFGTVHAWGDGWIQDFRDGRYGDGAIMLSKTGDTDTAYAIWGKHWELYKQQTMLGTQPPTSGMEWLGYPTSDHRQPSAEEAAQLTWFDNSSPPENLSQGSVIYTKLGYITFKEGTDHAWWATITNHIAEQGDPPSFLDKLYGNVAKLFRVELGANGFSDYAPVSDREVGLIDWTKPTVILTHGWNDGLTFGAEYIKSFATDFSRGRTNDDISAFNILAVDWNNDNASNGSNPNGFDSLADLLVDAGFPDANQSALNGILAAKPLAEKLVNAGVHPDNVMLIGHSNGAGFMASLAERLFSLTARKVQELVALDAPYLTLSYWEILNAAGAVERIDNYYITAVQSTLEVISVPRKQFDLALGFGNWMFSSQASITNIELNIDVSDAILPSQRAHNQVPLRFAMTGDNNSHPYPWGFQSTHMAGSEPRQTGGVWVESSLPARFEQVISQDELSEGLLQQIYSLLAGAARQVATRVQSIWDNAVLVANSVSNALKGVNSWISEVTQSIGARLPVIHGLAHSPVVAQIDIRVPVDASVLGLNLSILNPGNNDTLLVGMDSEIIGEIDLASRQSGSAEHFDLWIKQYAGQTVTLTFYLPSDGPSSAEFIVSDLELISVNSPPIPERISEQVVTWGNELTFTARANDPEANGVRFGLGPNAPSGVHIDPITGVFTWTPTDPQSLGTFELTLAMTDDGPGNLRSTQEIVITVIGEDSSSRMYRAYNPTADYHFFTTSQVEFSNAVEHGYLDETTDQSGFAVLESEIPGSAVVYRLYNLQTGRHYYTTSKGERDSLVAIIPPPSVGADTRTVGWRFETDEGFLMPSASTGMQEIWRLYNSNSGVHLYTDSVAQRDAVLGITDSRTGLHPWMQHSSLGFGFSVDVSNADGAERTQNEHREPEKRSMIGVQTGQQGGAALIGSNEANNSIGVATELSRPVVCLDEYMSFGRTSSTCQSIEQQSFSEDIRPGAARYLLRSDRGRSGDIAAGDLDRVFAMLATDDGTCLSVEARRVRLPARAKPLSRQEGPFGR